MAAIAQDEIAVLKRAKSIRSIHISMAALLLLCLAGAIGWSAGARRTSHRPDSAPHPMDEGKDRISADLSGGAPHWLFAVAGDSRNCGDIVMPAIAAGTRKQGVRFFWHLGDVRRMKDVDQDFAQIHPGSSLENYRLAAWDDFVFSQVRPFGDMPFFLTIGNHETAVLTREAFTRRFSAWLDTPELRSQRMADGAGKSTPRTYYHWQRDGIDFVSLDNATQEQFDSAQLAWLRALLARDVRDDGISAIVVGMHKPLPDSLAAGLSMSDSSPGESSGRDVYGQLFEVSKSKATYLLAGHAHYYIGAAYDTPYWRDNGKPIPRWIVGTAGARLYDLPWRLHGNEDHREGVYGFLEGVVNPIGSANRVEFSFRQIRESEVPPEVIARFGQPLVDWCFAKNR